MEIIKWLLMPTALLIGFLLGFVVKKKVTVSNKINIQRLHGLMKQQAELETEQRKKYESLYNANSHSNEKVLKPV